MLMTHFNTPDFAGVAANLYKKMKMGGGNGFL